MLKILTALALALALLTFAMPNKVQAVTAEQNQSFEQRFEVNCSNEGYNQSCKVLGVQTGEQNQKISLRENLAPHQVVDTGLDLPMVMGSAFTIMTGAAAALIKIKSR